MKTLREKYAVWCEVMQSENLETMTYEEWLEAQVEAFQHCMSGTMEDNAKLCEAKRALNKQVTELKGQVTKLSSALRDIQVCAQPFVDFFGDLPRITPPDSVIAVRKQDNILGQYNHSRLTAGHINDLRATIAITIAHTLIYNSGN